MAGPQPTSIAEGDVVLIRARVRKVWCDSVVIRVAVHDGRIAKFAQHCVRPGVIAGREGGEADVPDVPSWRPGAGESP